MRWPLPAPRPAELDQPFHLFRSGDTIFVADWQRRRLTGWSLRGAPAGVLPAVDRFRGALPRARDAAGRWYFELRPPPGPDGSGNRDSAAIARTDLAGPRTTPWRGWPRSTGRGAEQGRRRLERRLLSGQDRWGIRPDGTLWVARVAENRGGMRADSGAVELGHQLPDRVLPVTENDRELFLNRFDAGLRPTVAQIPFAAIKAPFEGATSTPTGSSGSPRAAPSATRCATTGGGPHRRAGPRGDPPWPGPRAGDQSHRPLVAEPIEHGVRLLRFRLNPPAPAGAATP
ncbi:MAG: hypothetical protein IPI92_17660 [Gemmatimonadetes bacterium]|nr:hypothetical protein [Gemmatimonadota bacterium]